MAWAVWQAVDAGRNNSNSGLLDVFQMSPAKNREIIKRMTKDASDSLHTPRICQRRKYNNESI
jgi:hypothetical protein